VSIALRYAARSDVGLVRANNQDSAYAGPHLLVVADGMGGHAGGDVASSVAIAALAPLDGESHGPDDALDELERALEAARDEIVARTEAEPDLAGMGTTVTAILRAGNKLAMVHLGDSRGYLLRDGALTQVTTDHTFVQHLVNTGKITPEEAEHHPQRSVVMRVLGDFDPDVAPDLSVREARPGDRWLLCSDGLSGFVSGDTIADTLRDVADVDACADRLVQHRDGRGGGRRRARQRPGRRRALDVGGHRRVGGHVPQPSDGCGRRPRGARIGPVEAGRGRRTVRRRRHRAGSRGGRRRQHRRGRERRCTGPEAPAATPDRGRTRRTRRAGGTRHRRVALLPVDADAALRGHRRRQRRDLPGHPPDHRADRALDRGGALERPGRRPLRVRA
jgi:serine/threonine protein phosphatase PrpC